MSAAMQPDTQWLRQVKIAMTVIRSELVNAVAIVRRERDWLEKGVPSPRAMETHLTREIMYSAVAPD